MNGPKLNTPDYLRYKPMRDAKTQTRSLKDATFLWLRTFES
jgi:hypothetical protein